MKSRLQFYPRRTLVLHLLLVISLLLAQGAAYAHVSAHLKSSADTSGKASTQLCSECLEAAPLLGAAGAPYVPSVVQVAAVVVPVPALACGPVEYRSPYPFRSRAPPRSL